MKQFMLRRRHQRRPDQDAESSESVTGRAGTSAAVSDDAARLLLRILVLLDTEPDET